MSKQSNRKVHLISLHSESVYRDESLTRSDERNWAPWNSEWIESIASKMIQWFEVQMQLIETFNYKPVAFFPVKI